MILETGRVIAGRYQIIEQIGAGGMSIVYRAKDMKLGRDVTFKALREEHLSNDAFRERFSVEAKAVATMNHQNIVEVYDTGSEGGVHFIVMEYIDGETLKDLILKRAPFDNAEAVGVAMQIAAALSHAHKKGVIHRDIKPQNILLTHGGTVKVADFGIARSAEEEGSREPGDGSTLGSVHYISPEQARGGRITAQSDLYALGVLMFEMLTGALPFDADNPTDIALMHMHEPMPDVRGLNPDAYESVAGVIQKLARKDPDMRYNDADELLEDLQLAMARPGRALGGADADGRKPDADKSLDFKIVIGAVVTSLLIVGLLAAIILPRVLRRDEPVIKTPDMQGVLYEDAKAELGRAGVSLEITEEVYDDDVPAGVIISQNYAPDEEIGQGYSIGVVVSKGAELFEVPDLALLEINAVYDRRLPFNVIEAAHEYSDDVPRGVVISQEPPAGESLPKGGEVRLTISRGAELKKVTVPDVLGMTEDEAKTKLMGMGLVVGQIGKTASERYEAGRVTSQTPGGGKEAAAGTGVSITISTGKPTPTPTPEPSQPPTDAPPTASPGGPATKTIYIEKPNIDLGVTAVQLTIALKDSAGLLEIYNERVTVDMFPLSIDVTGTGMAEYQFFVNGIYVASQTIDFGG